MNAYYEETIGRIKNLIQEEQYQEAFDIIEDELSLPYIEKDSEDELVALYQQIKPLVVKNQVKSYDEEDIEQLLNGSLDEVFVAIEQLKKSNIRNHLEAIQAYLKNEPHFLAKAYLIEALMDQGVSDEFSVEHMGMNVVFQPCYIEPVMESDGCIQVINYLREWFENDNPSFLNMCVAVLVKEAYLMLPFNVEEEDSLELALAITRYVFIAYDDYQGYLAWIKQYEYNDVAYQLLINDYASETCEIN